MMITLVNSNALRIPLPDQSVQCCVTSPPYWGLRDYGISDQLGLEQTPDQYVANMVTVFREVRRVLRDDGVVWLNLGDSYSSGFSGQFGQNESSTMQSPNRGAIHAGRREPYKGLPPKQLIGIPWRVAFALQADGWWLRSDIIWHKTNCMPESVTDRPTKAHEYVFLLSKSARYFYDAEAIRERFKGKDERHLAESYKDVGSIIQGDTNAGVKRTKRYPQAAGRNRRTVWTIPTHPYSGAHFATFPPKLIEPMILAGTSEKGECPVCGMGWVRVVERIAGGARKNRGYTANCTMRNDGDRPGSYEGSTIIEKGWQPQCTHDAEPIPQLVLDPFIGSGTTALVARKLGRDCVGLDLSFTYLKEQATVRLELDKLAEWDNGRDTSEPVSLTDLPMFAEMEL